MSIAKSRLQQAKTHLISQIRSLIRDNRINKLGLITFNHKAKVAYPLTDKFDEIINQIYYQSAQGQTALNDSLKFAANQLRCSENPRILIMTDGQDNCSTQRDMKWAQEWFGKDGLKSTFFTICEGNNTRNHQLAKTLQSNYINIGEQCWFSNSFDDSQLARGINHLR